MLSDIVQCVWNFIKRALTKLIYSPVKLWSSLQRPRPGEKRIDYWREWVLFILAWVAAVGTTFTVLAYKKAAKANSIAEQAREESSKWSTRQACRSGVGYCSDPKYPKDSILTLALDSYRG